MTDMTFFEKLDAVMRQDFGERGLLSSLPSADLKRVSRELSRARRALIVTGFPVLCPDQSVTGETDGPLGAADLAFALCENGCRTAVVSDAVSAPLVRAALSVRCQEVPVICLPDEGTDSFAGQLFDQFEPTHVITIERPGKADDGHYHNMRGECIDFMTADADCILSKARRRSICTVSVGDGGNELGMGAFREQIEAFVPFGQTICAVQAADFALASGVSNWWGIGAAALLSLETGRFLLPVASQETEMLRRVLEAGGADGATKRREMTVDSLPLSVHLDILSEVSLLVREALCSRAA